MRLTAKAKKGLGQAARRIFVFAIVAFGVSIIYEHVWYVDALFGALLMLSTAFAVGATYIEITVPAPPVRAVSSANNRTRKADAA